MAEAAKINVESLISNHDKYKQIELTHDDIEFIQEQADFLLEKGGKIQSLSDVMSKLAKLNIDQNKSNILAEILTTIVFMKVTNILALEK